MYGILVAMSRSFMRRSKGAQTEWEVSQMKLIVASFILSGLMTSTALAQTSASAQNSSATSNSASISRK